jgi:hypothetical protein
MKVLELGTNERPMLYPPDETVIWRYMNLAKFVSLLGTSGLWFPRADQLGDPFEGSRSPALSRIHPDVHPHLDSMAAIATAMLPLHFVSCWSISRVESAALWDIYSGRNAGIAIRSTVGDLKAALASEPSEEWVTVAAVRYVDFQDGYVPVSMVTERLFYKRSSFAHERELRAVMKPMDWLTKQTGMAQLDRSTLERRLPTGWPVPVDLRPLVRAIHVSPLSPAWFLDVIQSLVERYGLDVEVERSDLDRDPVF